MGIKLLTSTIAVLAGLLNAAQVCDLAFTACPSQLPAGPVIVPPEVISLDVHIPYCTESGKISSGASPSIMFVIDNSGSMSTTDPSNARYSVVKTLLDSIYAVSPNAKVGLSIFAGGLMFDWHANPLFQKAFPNDNTKNDAYVPLIPLDTTFGDGGVKGVDTLKDLLKFTVDPNCTRRCGATLTYGTNTGNGGTDITLGFLGALQAMKNSTSPKEAQFIIFLSDGAPNVNSNRQQYADDYKTGANTEAGGVKTPTTYTVFFDPVKTTPPQEITDMTNMVKADGYSTSNPNSSVFTINLPGSELQSILQKSVLNQILVVPTTGKDVTVSITGGGTQTTKVKSDSSHFLINQRMPLNATTTQLNFTYTHSFTDTTYKPPLIRDTTFKYSLTVQRGNGTTMPSLTSKSCRDQATLGLYENGVALTSVSASQLNLEARLTPTPGSTCANCSVAVRPSQSADRETIPLVAATGYYSGPFSRMESATPIPGDGKLQHLASDSIVLIWTNPENALDVVRQAYPYQIIPSSLALYAGGKEIDTITADYSELEVRLTRAPSVGCVNCSVKVSATGSADQETVPLTASGTSFNGMFIQVESVTPVAADGKIQHLSTDQIVITWTNPDNPADKISKTYPFKSIAPTLALFGGGKQIDTVTAAFPSLEIHLTLPSGEPCAACVVQVYSTGGPDKESIVMSGTGPYKGSFAREVSLLPTPNDGKLEHGPKDSIVLFYQNPLNPSEQIRRAYLYINFTNIVGIVPHNSVAKTTPSQQDPKDGKQWIISDAPGIMVTPGSASGSCCRVLPSPADSKSPDSSSTVGIIVEASREFILDLNVFSNLGQFVNNVHFTVSKEEFMKLSPVPGKDTRFMRLLWNGMAKSGARAGTGAYIFKTSITLLPIPGIADAGAPTTSIRRFGILREKD